MAKRRRPAPRPKMIKPAEPGRTLPWPALAGVLLAIALAAIPFCMGKYIEFNSPGPFDSGSYVYSAQRVVEGARLGIDERASAKIGTLLANMLGVWLFGFSETGPMIVQTVLQLAALGLLFYALRRLYGLLAAAVTLSVVSIYLSSPAIMKFGNVKEQYMIAFMVMGVSCFVLRQLGGRWFWALLAGALVAWAPLFKPTGVSAIGALGIFVLAQPILKHRTWKQSGADVLLLLAGAAVSLAPVYIWLMTAEVRASLPYAFVWKTLFPAAGTAGKATTGYVARSWKAVDFGDQAATIFRWYRVLILPMALALGAIVARIVRAGMHRKSKGKKRLPPERFVFLFGIWWLLDVAFVWISPRSYEQYYLPLTASGAILGAYVIWLYRERFSSSPKKGTWVLVGAGAVIAMLIMSWHIFFGLTTSPFHGTKYPAKDRGFAQSFKRVKASKRGHRAPWERVGEHIREHSSPEDTIYVWGWLPGIYVEAQRLSTARKACESEMHVKGPYMLDLLTRRLLAGFAEKLPKFIVDTRKKHFPWDRPPLELWPLLRQQPPGSATPRLVPLDASNKQLVARYEVEWVAVLEKKFGPEEADRFRVMKSFRDFVMGNYRIVPGNFGEHVLFEYKGRAGANTK